MSMSWFKRKQIPEKQAADAVTERLEWERSKRKSALARLMQNLEELPLDNAIADIGKDIGGQRK